MDNTTRHNSGSVCRLVHADNYSKSPVTVSINEAGPGLAKRPLDGDLVNPGPAASVKPNGTTESGWAHRWLSSVEICGRKYIKHLVVIIFVVMI